MKPFESAYPTQTQWSPRQEKWQGVLTRETDVSDAETADLLTSYLVIIYSPFGCALPRSMFHSLQRHVTVALKHPAWLPFFLFFSF